MNFLAHCYLSCSDDELLFGNFITDLLRPSELAPFEGAIAEGIRLHRVIDAYTDSHPASLALKDSLRPRHGKYAPVVVDLLWDYCLAFSWEQYSTTPMDRFIPGCYSALQERTGLLPVRIARRVDRMIADDFLNAYTSPGRMRRSLAWMDRRANFPSNFISAMEDLEENHSYYHELFGEFFPDIISHIRQLRAT